MNCVCVFFRAVLNQNHIKIELGVMVVINWKVINFQLQGSVK